MHVSLFFVSAPEKLFLHSGFKHAHIKLTKTFLIAKF